MKTSLQSDWEYCEGMLPLVSRTFVLNIRQLTGTLYRSVLIGYLLFRMADTIEDSPNLSEGEKIDGLTFFSRLFDHVPLSVDLDFDLRPLAEKVAQNSPEGDLVAHGDRVLQCYAQLPKFHQVIIGRAIKETSLGMAYYQRRRDDLPQGIFQLRNWNDLTRYCYYVAGIVGKMLTELFCLNDQLTPFHTTLKKKQIHFGIGLQMTNIAKDYPRDLQRGWCYLPKVLTDEVSLDVNDLLYQPNLKRREIISLMIRKTLPHLDEAYRYIATIPFTLKDIRMFCIIPFTLAYHTLNHLKRTEGEKLPREDVLQILKRAETFCSSNTELKADYERTLRDTPLTNIEKIT